jgi:integrase
VRDVLRNALNQALRWGLVARNVATLVDPPAVAPTETTPFSPLQARRFVDAIRGDRLEALYQIALTLGLRQGEVLGLRWEDVDLERRTLRIAVALQSVGGTLQLVTPKTSRSRRTLPLPAAVVAALHVHRAHQLEERLVAGSAWQEHGLVFTTQGGTPIHPRNLVRSFHRLLKQSGLPPMRFHDLRHSCLSLLAAQGVPARVAMDIAGHSDIRLTQNSYTHVFDEGKRQAAQAMDVLFSDVRGNEAQVR